MERHCINNIQSNSSDTLQDVSFNFLRRLKAASGIAFKLKLSDSLDMLLCHEILRLMPGKRLVALGTWGNRSVVIKLFFSPRKAAQHARRDYTGIKALTDAAVLAPKIYYYGTATDKRIQVIVYEKMNGLNLHEVWEAKKNVGELHALLKTLTIELATQHVLGVLQHDLFSNI